MRRFTVLLAFVLICMPAVGLGQGTQVSLPGDRYSVSPYLQDSYLFTQSTTGSDAIRLDFSFGIKYMRQPWRLYLETNPDAVQVPVDDYMQFRPAASFTFRRWFDVGLVVPVSYQTKGGGDVFIDIPVQDGAHLADPELFIRVPILHERRNGFGLAFASQLYLPLGQSQNFVGVKSWQGTVLLIAADWHYHGFTVALNTGAHLREHARVLDTPIEPEWLIRPAVSYSVPVGSYSIGFAAEANIGTSVYNFFSSENVDAFQMLLSVQIQPAALTEGVYGAAGGGATALGDGGGYAVPLAHFEGRVGYSMQWGAKRRRLIAVAKKEPGDLAPAGEVPPTLAPEGERLVATTGPKEPTPTSGPGALPPEPTEEPIEEPPEEPVEEPPEEPVKEPPEVAMAVPEPIAAERAGELPPGEEPIEDVPYEGPRVAAAPVAGLALMGVSGFRFNEPFVLSPDRPQSYVDSQSSPAVPPTIRSRVVSQVRKNLDKIRSSAARILIVGYADKCFEGFPYLANVYNMELSQRRVIAVTDALKEDLGGELEGVAIHQLPMGRRCANPQCDCRNPEMPACSDDRRVEIYVDSSDEPFRCSMPEYWLAP